MNTSPTKNLPIEAIPPIALDTFIERVGISPTTAWRWRKSGMLKTINICGRQYVAADELIRFNQRAAAGEFAKAPGNPSQRRSK